MDYIIDANILFSVLIKKGMTEDLLFKTELCLYAPEFMFEEFEKYKILLLEKTQRTPYEFEQLLSILRKKIHTIPNQLTKQFLQKAQEISPDSNDVEYFALALLLDCPIWSNDKAIKEKQNLVPVYTTEEIAKRM